MAVATLTFQVYKHYQLIATQSFSTQVIKIGSLSSSHLCLEDDSVSRVHAVIEVNGSDISIIDLGSTRGVLVNGLKVNKASLNNGDTIAVGDIQLDLQVVMADAFTSQQSSAQGGSTGQSPQYSPQSPPAQSGQHLPGSITQQFVRKPAGSITQQFVRQQPVSMPVRMGRQNQKPRKKTFLYAATLLTIVVGAVLLVRLGLGVWDSYVDNQIQEPSSAMSSRQMISHEALSKKLSLEAIARCPEAVALLGNDIRLGAAEVTEAGLGVRGFSDYSIWRQVPIEGSKSHGTYNFDITETDNGLALSSGSMEVDGRSIDIRRCNPTGTSIDGIEITDLDALKKGGAGGPNTTSYSTKTTSSVTINGKSTGKAKVMEFYIEKYAEPGADGILHAMKDSRHTSPRLLGCMEFAYSVYGQFDLPPAAVKNAKKHCKKGFSVVLAAYLLGTYPDDEKNTEKSMGAVLKSVNRYGAKVGDRLELVQFVTSALTEEDQNAALYAIKLVAKRRKATLKCVADGYYSYKAKYGASKGIEKALRRCK